MFKLKSWNHDWYYCKSDGDTRYGLNDAGCDMFAGNPFKYLAREICQNSIDVRRDPKKPVIVEFHSFEVDQYLIPQIGELQDALNRAGEFWSDQQNDPAVGNFITGALTTAKGDKIKCLRISDWNTTGLTGSKNANGKSPWFSLVKGTGISDKPAGSGGSKGIGKYAPFACSDLRTVFYSTKAEDKQEASEGVSRLVSFIGKDNKLTTGLGYYSDGTAKRGPIRKYYSLDPKFTRKDGDYGTDIFVIGFREDEDWIDKITGSVLDGFLYAIQDDRLVVKANDRVIDKKHLAKIFEDLKPGYLAEHANEYYQVLTDKNSQTFEPYEIKDSNGNHFGYLKLKALLNPGFSRTCAMIRQVGMKIKDLNGISSFIYFSAVLYIEGDGINNYLRNLENSAHTAWETERISDPKKKKEAKALLRKIRKYVDDCIQSLHPINSEKAVNLSIGEYLSADVPDQGHDKKKKEDITDDVSNVSYTVITRTANQKESENSIDAAIAAKKNLEGDQTPAPGEEPEHKKNVHVSKEGNPRDGVGGYENADKDTPKENRYQLFEITSSRTRALVRDSKQGKYTLIFTPNDNSSEACLDVFLSAESQDYNADISSASLDNGKQLTVENGRIKGLSFTKGTPIKVNVVLSNPGLCAMEVKGYGNKE